MHAVENAIRSSTWTPSPTHRRCWRSGQTRWRDGLRSSGYVSLIALVIHSMKLRKVFERFLEVDDEE